MKLPFTKGKMANTSRNFFLTKLHRAVSSLSLKAKLLLVKGFPAAKEHIEVLNTVSFLPNIQVLTVYNLLNATNTAICNLSIPRQ